MCAGTREDGSVIAANDPMWDDLNKAARAAKADPMVWLAQRTLYGDLADNARFSTAFASALTRIWSDGLPAVLTDYLAEA